MKYSDYLKSEHWKNLKKEVLSRRGQCQNCTIKKKLLLHHKNYNCLFKEKDSDLIVLCFDCHHRKHKKKKFKTRGVDLNFTAVKNRDKDLYKIADASLTQRLCSRCAEYHGLVYRIFRNGTKHLAIVCHNSSPRIAFIPFEDNLDIPVLGQRART